MLDAAEESDSENIIEVSRKGTKIVDNVVRVTGQPFYYITRFPCRKPASPARGNRQRLYTGESRQHTRRREPTTHTPANEEANSTTWRRPYGA